MIPPSFSDLGKAAKDLFDKKFKFGLLGVDCSSSGRESVTLKVEGAHDLRSKTMTGSLESKHGLGHGIDVTTKWTTKNLLTLDLTHCSSTFPGMKSTALVTLEPDSGKKSLKVKENYKRDLLNINSELLFTSLKPLVNVNMVLGCTQTRGYLVGADLQVDSQAQKVSRHILALGYQKSDLSVILSVQGLSLFTSLIHQKVSDQCDLGINVSYNKQSQELKYGLVGQYKVSGTGGTSHHSSFVKAKIDQDSKVGVAYGTNLDDGVEVSICGEIDGRNVEMGAHNIGVGISYCP